MNTTSSHTHGSSRDFFLYLLGLITLFATVISFISMWFGFIDVKFPDNIYDTYNYHSGQIRTSISTLLVMFPVYIGLAWFLRKDTIAHPEKRELSVRKFLIHLTLFAASLVIIVDLISLINQFLEGELTTRFVLKIIVVLFTAVAVFAYYLYDLRRETESTMKPSKLIVGAAIAVVIGSIITGFFIIGSPATQRLRRLDEHRLNDLMNIHSEILRQWEPSRALASSLEDLQKKSTIGFTVPLDPETQKPYEYMVKGPLSFALCATFTLANETNDLRKGRTAPPYPESLSPYAYTWDHEAGRVCFDRAIDPKLYPKPPL